MGSSNVPGRDRLILVVLNPAGIPVGLTGGGDVGWGGGGSGSEELQEASPPHRPRWEEFSPSSTSTRWLSSSLASSLPVGKKEERLFARGVFDPGSGRVGSGGLSTNCTYRNNRNDMGGG